MPRKFTKLQRPQQPPSTGRISARDLDLVETILRYRFCPTSQLIRLLGGNHNVTKRRLTWLWRQGLVSRFFFSDPRKFQSEFHYYLDSAGALNLLIEHGRLEEIHPTMEAETRQNREAGYQSAWLDVSSGQSLFLRHELMISRLRFMLEMACWQSGGAVQLISFRQGADLQGVKVTAPAIRVRRSPGTNEYEWFEGDTNENYPVQPDALFTLRFRERPEGARDFHFCYEADRATMPAADMLRKLRGGVGPQTETTG